MALTAKQVAEVLALACTFDPRLKPPSAEDARARAHTWAAALRTDMDPEWAQKAVVAHYATNDKVLLPVHLNEAWDRYVVHRAAQERIERDRRARREAEITSVPMPPDVREALNNARRALPHTEEV